MTLRLPVDGIRGFFRLVIEELRLARLEIRQGRFQRSMAAVTATGALIGGFEAYLQHLHGAFKHWQMWTPIFLTPPVLLTSGGAIVSNRLHRSFLPALQIVSMAWLAAGAVGFVYHVRGVRRLPGGFGLGRYNITMGPPLFAPLLLTGIGTMGLIAEMLRPEKPLHPELKALPEGTDEGTKTSELDRKLAPKIVEEVSHGEFQVPMALISAFFSALAGAEVYFEHHHGSFSKKMMWAPLLVTPPMIAAGAGTSQSEKIGGRPLGIISGANLAVGILGSFFHIRAVQRMPGGFSNFKFNVANGPPLFAPLLFTMVGTMGLIASLLRRRRNHAGS